MQWAILQNRQAQCDTLVWMAIQIGDVLGDYQVIGVLGRGGMGKVFRVRSLLTDREEAMKVLLSDFDENPDIADRFLREIKVHARLQHPNIASLRTALRIGERLFMLMELVEGASLAEKLREGPLSVAGLHRLHDAGAVRPRLRTRCRRDPPRHQAREHPDRQRRRREAHRFRDCPRLRYDAPDQHRSTPSARSPTCRPSRSALASSTRDRICTRWGSRSTKW